MAAAMPATMRPSVDLPQPDSPTRPTTSPRADGEIDVVDRVHDLVLLRRAKSARDGARDASGCVEVGPKRFETPRSSMIGACGHAGTAQQRMEAARRLARHRLRRFRLLLADGIGARAALAERAARRQARAGDGVMPGICRSGSPRTVAAGHAAEQAARVGMQRRGRAPSPPAPVSTMRPAYITRDRRRRARRPPTGRA